MTAAHCVWGATDILIEMGHSNTTSEKTVLNIVKSMLIHPEYEDRSKTKNHDIALLRMHEEITFNNAIQPIAISKKEVQDSFEPFLVYPQGYIISHLMLEL